MTSNDSNFLEKVKNFFDWFCPFAEHLKLQEPLVLFSEISKQLENVGFLFKDSQYDFLFYLRYPVLGEDKYFDYDRDLKENRIYDCRGHILIPDSSIVFPNDEYNLNFDFATFDENYKDTTDYDYGRVEHFYYVDDIEKGKQRTKRLICLLLQLTKYNIYRNIGWHKKSECLCLINSVKDTLEYLLPLEFSDIDVGSDVHSVRKEISFDMKRKILSDLIRLKFELNFCEEAIDDFKKNFVKYKLDSEFFVECFMVIDGALRIAETEEDKKLFCLDVHKFDSIMFEKKIKDLVEKLESSKLFFISSLVGTHTPVENNFELFKAVLLSITNNVEKNLEERMLPKSVEFKILSEEYKKEIENSSLETIISTLKKYKFYGDDEFAKECRILNELLRKQLVDIVGIDNREFYAKYDIMKKWYFCYYDFRDITNNYGQRRRKLLEILQNEIEKRERLFIVDNIKQYEEVYDDENKLKDYVCNFLRVAEIENVSSVKFKNLDDEYKSISNNKKLIQQLVSSQLFYEDFSMRRRSFLQFQGDFTYLIVGFIKSLERYLKEIWLHHPSCKRTYIWGKYKRYWPKDFKGQDADDFHDCSKEGEQLFYPTIDSVANAISSSDIVKKMPNSIFYKKEKNDCSKFQKEFVKKIRNGHLHVHMVDSINEAEKIYRQTAWYFRKCIDEFIMLPMQ